MAQKLGALDLALEFLTQGRDHRAWQPISPSPLRGPRQTSAARAIFDASVACANIDSPNTARPSATQYSPPARRPFTQVSTLCAWPAACSAE